MKTVYVQHKIDLLVHDQSLGACGYQGAERHAGQARALKNERLLEEAAASKE
jgi:hypothetical protein